MLWPVLFRSLRVYAPYITLPFAAFVGYIGYTLENKLSSKYTPYNNAIKDQRRERLLSDETLASATNVAKSKYNNVLERNLSPSLADERN